MITKLLITLKYGETKVKMYLIGVIVLLIAGLVLLISGISGNSLIFLGTGAVLLIAGLLVMFSFSFVDINVDLENKNKEPKTKKSKDKKDKEKEEKNSEFDKKEDEHMDIDFSMLEEDLSDLAIGVGSTVPGVGNSSKEEKAKDEKKGGSKNSESDDDLEAMLRERESDESYGLDEIMAYDTGDDDRPSASRKEDVYEVKKPTAKQIKARKKMLKVRKDDRRYTPVFIDSWKEARVLHTPAFIQEKGRICNIILVEGALRTELMPMGDFLKVTYQKNVEEKFAESYEEIRNDPDVNVIFGDLLPSLYQGTERGTTDTMFKNLYIMGGKIAITPRSLRKMFNKFDFEFEVFDSLNIHGKYSDYFKEAYESRIFWTDNVISQNDYQARIRRTLQAMVDDKELKNEDFDKDIELMVRYNLITREYADYYKARKMDNIKIKI